MNVGLPGENLRKPKKDGLPGKHWSAEKTGAPEENKKTSEQQEKTRVPRKKIWVHRINWKEKKKTSVPKENCCTFENRRKSENPEKTGAPGENQSTW